MGDTMTDEPYWEMYASAGHHMYQRVWNGEHIHIQRTPDHIKKRLNTKHSWTVFNRGDMMHFPSREKAARFWALSR